jgi:prepilin-type N-terminal cleavage/methylation domain-containing protein
MQIWPHKQSEELPISGSRLTIQGTRRALRAPRSAFRTQVAFTLLELLVVIVIIGLLTTIGLPAIRGMTKSNVTIAANRQLLDDVAYARQRAISDHTTVYMVFIPGYIVNEIPRPPTGSAPVLAKYTNLFQGQFTTYALLTMRSVGEQPGRSTPTYITEWRSLPKGCFIATNKFDARYTSANPPPASTSPVLNIIPFRTVANFFPFPVATNSFPSTLPYLAFDYLGRLTPDLNGLNHDEYIPLALGSIFYAPAAGGGFDLTKPADVLETPPQNSVNISNVIHIDWLTGHARIERQEVQ